MYVCIHVQVSNGIHMRKVKKVVVVPLFRNGRPLSDSKQKDEDRYLQLLHMYVCMYAIIVLVYSMYVLMCICSTVG